MKPKRRSNSAENQIKSKNIFDISCEHEPTQVVIPAKNKDSGHYRNINLNVKEKKNYRSAKKTKEVESHDNEMFES